MLAEANQEIRLAFDTANAQRQAYRASELLPPGVAGPSSWPRRTARVIDRCFDLQQRVLSAQRRLHRDDAD
jgi:hypothetical protein